MYDELAESVKKGEDNVAMYRICSSCNSERTYFGEAVSNIGEEASFVV